ncbi:metalloregulator ArsR/SmtB family transcription factor [Thermoanaerobacterium sp. RBIITD]|uniref:ArsR/SmtB family transcription factor n=1 Tax=Thermoanaerobacterium sp. RBIITD TaxID=1550240 RepID=UPI00156068E7
MNHKIDIQKDFKKYEDISEKLKVIAHPYRLCIVKGLLDGGCNVTTIQECLNLPQSTVSQHLSKLKAAGIIKGERNGLEICYKVVDQDIINVINILLKE